MSRKLRPFSIAIIFVALIMVDAELARAQSPADPKTQGYAALTSTLTSITGAASGILLQSPDERSAGRLLYLRKRLATKLIAAIVSGKTISFDDLDAPSLLCDFRSQVYPLVAKGDLSSRDPSASVTVDYLTAKANVKYLASVAGKLNPTAPAQAKNLISALEILFTNYNFKVPPVSVSAKDRRAVTYSCNTDMGEFASAYYGMKIEPPKQEARTAATAPAAEAGILPDLSFFGPIGMFVQTALGVITPVVEDIANIESTKALEQAINTFLDDKKNQAALESAGTNLAQAISDYSFAKRLSLAGSFAEQVAVIKTAPAIDITKVAACNPPLKPPPSAPPHAPPPTLASVMLPDAKATAPSDQFMICYRAVWTMVQDRISAALTTAATYDLLADSGDTATLLTQFKTLTSNHFAEAKGQPPSGQDLLANVLAVVNFASDVATAVSPANRAKRQQAVDSMVKLH